jgi:hypothetical protein
MLSILLKVQISSWLANLVLDFSVKWYGLGSMIYGVVKDEGESFDTFVDLTVEQSR